MEHEMQWIKLENFKIYSSGIWEKTEPDNPLSELVEISAIDYLGLENGIHIYKCTKLPKSIKSLMKNSIEDGDDIYLGVSSVDIEQTALLWPY